MSHGRHGGRSTTRPSFAVSSSSSSSSVSSQIGASPDFSSIQKVMRDVFRSSEITIQQVERLQGRLYQVYLSKLGDGSSLVVKCSPPFNTRLLRHEKHGLETERKALETLREYTPLPVPRLIKYDSHGGDLGMPFILMTQVPGRRLSEFSSILSASERNTIDRTLGGYVRSLTVLSATQYGSTHRVFSKRGSSSWREAFLALLEAALRDAEDMLVTVPYDNIRCYIGRHSHRLDEVTEPRLVAIYACNPNNVILDEQTRQITGLVGFSNVVWGDPLMSGGIEGGSDAFFEGYGERPVRTEGAKVRMLMYATYRAVLQIVAYHYRPQLEVDELNARRSLTNALNDLAQM
ncbi:hypothetical protein CC78DRAFT_478252 [Lojkania enalia]|uniref:Aminoglycoside phosphotransferase domain-containing protein n=1 Tax=Lojkania enalia TaxID=147567 RepID=A0A9P4MV40_9PLEO|nr:hypothetical protein CC78DRAFT_478252 [Didymosphaeria enalia]